MSNKTLVRGLSAAAILAILTGSAYADMDENGIVPSNWLKFDKTSNFQLSAGSSTLTWGDWNVAAADAGAKGGSVYLKNYPYSTNAGIGNGAFSIVSSMKIDLSKRVDTSKPMALFSLGHGWSHGTKGFGIKLGDDNIELGIWGAGITLAEGAVTSVAHGITDFTVYHTYAMTMTMPSEGNKTLKVYIDGIEKMSIEVTAIDSWNTWKSDLGFFCSCGGSEGNNWGASRPTNNDSANAIDDLRIYQTALTAAQLAEVQSSRYTCDNNGVVTAVTAGTTSLDAGTEGAISVATGATLKLHVTGIQQMTGYNAESVTLAEGATLQFIGEDGSALAASPDDPRVLPSQQVPEILIDTNMAWPESAPTSGSCIINVSGDCTITVDKAVALDGVSVKGTGSISFTIADGGSFTIASLDLAETATIRPAMHMITGAITGTGTVVVNNGMTDDDEGFADWFASNAMADFAGTLHIEAGRFRTSALNSSISIKVTDGGQLYTQSGNGDFNNKFIISGNGWTSAGDQNIKKVAIRCDDVNIGGSIKSVVVDNKVPAIGSYNHSKTISATIDTTEGDICLFASLDNVNNTISGVISGAGKVVKEGAGTVTISGDNTYTGGTLISGGTIVMDNIRAIGQQNSCDVTINQGGKLVVYAPEYNGYNWGSNVTLAGGTLANTRSNVSDSKAQIKSISLTASSTIQADYNFGIIGPSYAANTLTMNGYTLSKTGDGTFYMHAATATAGTIDIIAGTITVGHSANLSAADVMTSTSGKSVKLINNVYSLVDAPTRPTDIEGGSQAQKDAFDAWVAKQTGLTDPSAANINAFILDMPNESTEKALEAKLASLITPEMVQKLASDGATTETTVTIPGYGCATFKFVPVEEIETSAKLFRLKASFVPANSQN